jgi:hypothetical protein
MNATFKHFLNFFYYDRKIRKREREREKGGRKVGVYNIQKEIIYRDETQRHG